MTFHKDAEKQDNENYSKNFTRVPNILFVSYKHLSKEEKFLYCTLRQIYWDMKPRFVTLRELSELTGYSPSALCKMIPRLHICGLIHAEVRKEKGRDGKEKGNAKYHITIPDIWEINRQFFASSPEQQVTMDPSLKLVHKNEQDSRKPVHENEQACSPNNTSLFTKTNRIVPFGEQDQARVERAKDSNKDIVKDTLERKNGTSQQTPNITTGEASHSPIHSSSSHSQNSFQETKPEEEVELTEEEQIIYGFGQQTIFKAKPPLKTAKLKGECAELAKHITTVEQFQSLLQFVRALPYIQGQVHLKNLVNELNGWLQSLEARPSSRTKPRGPVIVQQPTESEQEEIDRKNAEAIAKLHAMQEKRRQARQQEGANV